VRRQWLRSVAGINPITHPLPSKKRLENQISSLFLLVADGQFRIAFSRMILSTSLLVRYPFEVNPT
jgi:hypothetical protein